MDATFVRCEKKIENFRKAKDERRRNYLPLQELSGHSSPQDNSNIEKFKFSQDGLNKAENQVWTVFA